jgi:tetratricopeptide (TPR) repeat protein
MLDPQRELEEGFRLWKAGMVKEAVEHYRATARHSAEPRLVAEALLREAWAYRAWCKWDEAIDAAQRGAAIAQRADLQTLYAEALNAEALVYQARGEFDAAVPRYEEMLSVTNDPRLRGVSQQNLGSIAAQRGDLDGAERYFLESSQSFERARYGTGEAIALNNYAAVALDRGKWELAEVTGRQAMEAAQRVGDLELVSIAAMNIAEALAGRRQWDKAEALVTAALGHFSHVENPLRQAQCLRVLGDVHLMRGDASGAAMHYNEALRRAVATRSDFEAERIRDCLEAVLPDT